MAELTTKARNALPKSEFGIPGSRKYPMPDKAHAQNAKSRASAQYHQGKIGAATYHTILAKANRKLGKTAADG